MSDYIVEHHNWQRVAYVDFIRGFYEAKHGPLPSVTAVASIVRAEINQGRWIVLCPRPGCRGAMCVTSQTPLFICIECGSPENNGHWYGVYFPPWKAALEALLLRRPARDPEHAANRNWVPSETLDEVRADNRAHGLED